MARGGYSRASGVNVKVSEPVFATAAIAAAAAGQTIGQWVEGAVRYTAEAEWRRQNGMTAPPSERRTGREV